MSENTDEYTVYIDGNKVPETFDAFGVSTVVGDQVLLVFSDALETDFCRIFTASMLTKGE